LGLADARNPDQTEDELPRNCLGLASGLRRLELAQPGTSTDAAG
jgi:hypothetical protein